MRGSSGGESSSKKREEVIVKGVETPLDDVQIESTADARKILTENSDRIVEGLQVVCLDPPLPPPECVFPGNVE